MPIYEYYCAKDDKVFDAMASIANRDKPVKCPKCGREGVRIMPTTVATMSRVKGLVERVPFHHADVRADKKKRTIAPVKPPSKPKAEKKRKSSAKKKSKKTKTKAKG
jgi:putative FmdB family regulatory protein